MNMFDHKEENSLQIVILSRKQKKNG